jgi:hypothetical protein
MAISTLQHNSTTPYVASSGVSIDNTRRLFNFGERVAELDPIMSPFFTYLSKLRRDPTDDPVFKFLEERHQWQRRNFEMGATETTSAANVHGAAFEAGDEMFLTCHYDVYGKLSGTTDKICEFIVPGQVLAIKADSGIVYRILVDKDCTIVRTASAFATAESAQAWADGDKVIHHDSANGLTGLSAEGITVTGVTIPISTVFTDGNKGQVIGTAFPEGAGTPVGWRDELSDIEGYCQIFRTAMPMMSGTQMSTRYRGRPDEWKRVWAKKLKEHKMDLEHASLFGYGKSAVDESASSAAPVRYSWGMIPYVDLYGKSYSFSYASSGYDAFLDAMEDYFAPEGGNSGNKLVLASRKVISFLNRMGDSGFLKNTVGSSAYRLDVQNIKGAFGHEVTKVSNIFGNLHFVSDPLLRGPWEDYAVCVDLANVAWRPLIGNGKSRDTFIKTNVQDNGSDGRVDEILTEAGLKIDLAETHATLKFS